MWKTGKKTLWWSIWPHRWEDCDTCAFTGNSFPHDVFDIYLSKSEAKQLVCLSKSEAKQATNCFYFKPLFVLTKVCLWFWSSQAQETKSDHEQLILTNINDLAAEVIHLNTKLAEKEELERLLKIKVNKDLVKRQRNHQKERDLSRKR